MVYCENLVKIYKTRETEVVALQGLDLSIEQGELMAIIGNSGSGKSTLLNMIGGLDRPSAGTLLVDGKDLLKFSERDYVRYKRDTVGFVWQNNARNLIPYMTAMENVQLPMVLVNSKQRAQRARELLELVGLSQRRNSRLSQMSGGEQQRVAIAISLANSPKLVLADEPTGSVDTRTADIVLDLLRDVNRQLGVTIMIVTHDLSLSRKVDRIVAIRDGRTSSEFLRKRSYIEEIRDVATYAHEAGDDSHVELAVVDGTGRLQIPHEYLDEMGVKGKAKLRVEMQDGKVVIYKPQDDDVEGMRGGAIVP
ncbi:MAG: ABC transporter ATP-binding protein [Eubacteriales bacterium]|nr:ABC transporter ATP-binding protein [Eubacteriales bacterium]